MGVASQDRASAVTSQNRASALTPQDRARAGSPHDRLDALVAQWNAVRPDLDVEVMAEVARLLHVARLIGERLGARADELGLQVGEADVLFTLFRAGPPHRLSPTRLAESTLVTTGTMTNRLDKLEARGLIRRLPNPEDRRGLAVELTADGHELVDRHVGEHVDGERQMLAALSERERAQLTRLLRKLLEHLESSRPSGRSV
jgi:DNA-binding MarR family transcriptional regulator